MHKDRDSTHQRKTDVQRKQITRNRLRHEKQCRTANTENGVDIRAQDVAECNSSFAFARGDPQYAVRRFFASRRELDSQKSAFGTSLNKTGWSKLWRKSAGWDNTELPIKKGPGMAGTLLSLRNPIGLDIARANSSIARIGGGAVITIDHLVALDFEMFDSDQTAVVHPDGDDALVIFVH